MKIILADNSSVFANRVSRTFNYSDDENKDFVFIDITATSTDYDSVKSIFNAEACTTVTVKRDSYADVVYSGYNVATVSEDVSETETNLTVVLSKVAVDDTETSETA